MFRALLWQEQSSVHTSACFTGVIYFLCTETFAFSMAEKHWLFEFQRSVKNKRHHYMQTVSPCKCMQMHVYNKAIYICPKPQSECICFDQSLKWDLSVGHKNNVCLKENSSGFRCCNEAVLFIVALLFVMPLRLCEHFPIILCIQKLTACQ